MHYPLSVLLSAACRLAPYQATVLTLLLASAMGTVPARAQEQAFPGVTGPVQRSELPAPKARPTDPARYAQGGNSGLAIFLRDSESSWLGLAHGLKAAGTPFVITGDLEKALQHDVVLVYPSITGANTSGSLLNRFQQFVQDGNTLIAFSVIGGGMANLFGYEGYQERNDLQSLTFGDSPLTSQFVLDPAEQTLDIAARGRAAAGVSFRELEHQPVARFDDGSAAITHKPYPGKSGTGHAYAVGFDFGHFALRAFNGRITGVEKDYVNAYHPNVDALFRFIAAAYWQGASSPVEILKTANNRDFTVLVTHDIDFTRSMKNVPAYVDLETELEIPATYFIQAKYITDYNDRAFFSEASRSVIELLVNSGMAVASHSIAHSNEFRNMPIGTGAESYPDYRPFVQDFNTVNKASIAGELRVSRFLLETLGATQVNAFRPGHLSLPRNLPEMLQATGYEFSSSITANEALTHLPYRTMYSSEYQTETAVFEFPVTIEDEQRDLLDWFDESVELTRRIGRHGGLVNLLIHTDEADRKLEFERRYVEMFRDRAWFTTVPAFGAWWRSRDGLEIDVLEPSESSRTLTVSTPHPIEGLSLRVPPEWKLQDEVAGVAQAGPVIILDRLSNTIELHLQIH